MQDAALIERLAAICLAGNVPKMKTAMLTDHYGFIVGTPCGGVPMASQGNISRSWSIGVALAVRLNNAVGGEALRVRLLKILHPDKRPQLTRGVISGWPWKCVGVSKNSSRRCCRSNTRGRASATSIEKPRTSSFRRRA